ncbi:ATPase domain-containing protein [Tropicimonas isoalkanivorans]|uniref:Circadian clock protein KaiC n=1 Tax=Tropicimonas isoalkanivorans TaxID=441112 RepID=A0A1I1NU96_9RHOB|nr:ATPase domain-containing protein [Tropicimonas isoalkanivorans]SFC97320.1 circadian clock protein KaiC [Tropicimonas isoalkanivorans]
MDQIGTGCAGFDHVLRGGYPRNSIHLLQGAPGTGKTTLALQFLMEGRDRGETCLYVTLSQTELDLQRIAASHGWSLDGIKVIEVSAHEAGGFSEQSIFQTADLRLDETRRAVQGAIDEFEPARLVYDSLLEIRLLSPDVPRYQRELIGFRDYIARKGITVLLVDTDVDTNDNGELESRGVVHSVSTLDKQLPDYGRAKRRMQVAKMRGVPIFAGWHDMDIREGEGVVVYPRLSPRERPVDSLDGELIRSGRERLDSIFGGGLEPGTTTMVVGQAGTGKSTIASLYATAALARGESVALFLFEERIETFFRRSEGLGMDLRDYYQDGRLHIYDFNPDEISAGEFTQLVQKEAEADDLRVVVIDSFTGYMSSLTDHSQALFDIQALLKHVSRQNVLTILIVAQHGLLGHNSNTPVDVSFLGDTVLFLRMHEEKGRVHRDIVAVKKRHGPHELDVRELVIESGNVDVGPAAR